MQKKLFITRHRELRECIENQSYENMLRLSVVLRQLLIDGSNLIDAVNREYRIKILYEVGFSTKERTKEMVMLGLPINFGLHFLGGFPPNEARRLISREEFLKFDIAKYDTEYFTIHELIKTCANRFGGAHIGSKNSDNATEANIRKFGDLLERFGLQHAFSSLILVGNVTYNALIELNDLVIKETINDINSQH